MKDSFNARSNITVNGKDHRIFRLDALKVHCDLQRLPYALKILLENLLRFEVTFEESRRHLGTVRPAVGANSTG